MTCPECYGDEVEAADYEIADRDTGYRESGTSYRCLECDYQSTDEVEWGDPDWDDAEVLIIQDAAAAITGARESECAIEALRRNPSIDGITARRMILGGGA